VVGQGANNRLQQIASVLLSSVCITLHKTARILLNRFLLIRFDTQLCTYFVYLGDSILNVIVDAVSRVAQSV
jgi:hypothetical protein